MKPIPNIGDEAAMILRGKQSALGSARKEASEALRDALVSVQSADWSALQQEASKAKAAAERLEVVAAMWSEL